MFDMKNYLTLRRYLILQLQVCQNKVGNRKLCKYWTKVDNQIIPGLNPIRIRFNIWSDGVEFELNFQIRLLIGLDLDVYASDPNSTRCYP